MANLVSNGNKWCRKVPIQLDQIAGATSTVFNNFSVDIPNLNGLEISSNSLTDASGNVINGTINGESIEFGDLPYGCYELSYCLTVVDATVIECPIVRAVVVNYDNCPDGENKSAGTFYQDCNDCSSAADCLAAQFTDGSPVPGSGTLNDPWVFPLPSGPIVIEGGNNVDVVYDNDTLTWTVNGCCTTFNAATGELTNNFADGTSTTNVITTNITAGNNITITGTGTPSDPIVVNGCCVSYDPLTGDLTITDAQGNDTVVSLVVNVTSTGDTVVVTNPTPGTFNVEVRTDLELTNNNNGTTTYVFTHPDGTTTTACYKNCDVGTADAVDGSHNITCGPNFIDVKPTGPDIPCTFGVTTYELVSNTPGITAIDIGNGVFVVEPEDCSDPFAGTENLVYNILCDGNVVDTATEFFSQDVQGDLKVAKDFSVDYAETGDTIQIVLIAENVGPGPITLVQLTDALAPNFTYSSDDGGSQGTTSNPGPFTWDVGNLAVGQVETLVINVIVAAAAGFGNLPNTVIGTSPDDPNDAYGSDVIIETPEVLTDLAITKTADVTETIPGGTVTFTITVVNNGPATSTGFTVEDVFDANYTNLASASPGVTFSGNTLTWNNNIPLPATQTLSITVTAEIADTAAGTIPNVSTITDSNENDPVSSNDTDNQDVRVLESDMSITKTFIAPPESRVTTGEPNDDGEVTLTFSQTKAGSAITTCECTRVEFELFQAGIPVYAEIQGDLCTPVENWTSVTGFDITPYVSGSASDGGVVVFAKEQWALDSGYNELDGANQFQNIIVHTYVGGNGCGTINDCPIESSNVDNSDRICRTLITGSDNQAFLVASDDGITKTFSNYSQPYSSPTNPNSGILGSIIQSPSSNSVIRLTNTNGPAGNCPSGGYWDVIHLASDVITLVEVGLTGSADITSSVVLTNIGPGVWNYPNEIGPAVVSLLPSLKPLPTLVGSINNPANLVCDGQVVNWMKFANCFDVGETLVYPNDLHFTHSEGGNTEIILNVNFLYGY